MYDSVECILAYLVDQHWPRQHSRIHRKAVELSWDEKSL